jgi:phospholipid/cholesterol/gamma-HCH transport system permease protein
MLNAMFIICGIWGGYLVGVDLLGMDGSTYMSSIRENTTFRDDVAGAIIKSIAFGILIGLVATYRGYTCKRTAEGVSSATTNTVVIASVSILIFDYVITALWGF